MSARTHASRSAHSASWRRSGVVRTATRNVQAPLASSATPTREGASARPLATPLGELRGPRKAGGGIGDERLGEVELLTASSQHGKVDGGADRTPRDVAEAPDVAVGDEPDDAVRITHPGDAKGQVLDHPAQVEAGGIGDLDGVADAVLVLDGQEDPGEVIANEGLRTEPDRGTDDGGTARAGG